MSEPTGTHPFAPFEWMLSLRYLRARRKEGFISVIAGFSFLGIMLGVATLIIVMAVMNGFRQELLDKILGLNGHLLIQPLESPLTDWQVVADRVGKVPGVRLAAPIVEGQALASSPFNASGVLVRGVRGGDLAKLSSVASNIEFGTLDGFDEGQGIAIGKRLAEQLSLRVGANLTLVAPRGAVTPMGTTPRIKAYKIAAIFVIGMSEYDAAFVFMPLPEAQAYFNRAGDVTAIEVYTDNPDRIDTYRKLIADAALRPIYMIDWRTRNATFFGALQVERNVMFLIVTLIILVAALNIVSGLIMLVKDKGPDIAIMRTMGATQGAIMRIFLITGASIGVVGTVIGFIVGILVCTNVESIRQFLSWLTDTELFPPELYFLSRLPAELDVGETTAVVIMALTLSLLATLYPSWRAARLDPVEALRYEGRDGRRCTGNLPQRHRAPLPAGRRHARYSVRRRACGVVRPVGGADRAVRRRQIDAAAYRRPARAAECRRSLHQRDGDFGIGRRGPHPAPAHRGRLRLSGASPAAGIHRAGKRDAAANGAGAQKPRRRCASARTARLSRPEGSARAPAERAFGRRAAACRDRAGGRQCAAHSARRRADRKPRSAHGRSGIFRPHPAGPRLRARRHHRHPQHGPRRPDGPPGDAARRQAGGTGIPYETAKPALGLDPRFAEFSGSSAKSKRRPSRRPYRAQRPADA